MERSETIIALASAQGQAGISIIRMSGSKVFKILSSRWKGKDLSKIPFRTTQLGYILNSNEEYIDQVLITLYKSPESFTGEDVVEISCHGSPFIVREIINSLMEAGAKPAAPGEFSKRAFINGKVDLAQAEGIADLIASESRAANILALRQTTGAFSKELNLLRDKIMDFASLLELELDFSEEDVNFADRKELMALVIDSKQKVDKLKSSFQTGKMFKEGIPTVIAGLPNAGKSTLLNCLLEDERAIVSDIPGTTRDTIEEKILIDGIQFRLIDTAGIHASLESIEQQGIARTKSAIKKASLIIWLSAADAETNEDNRQFNLIEESLNPDQILLRVTTKADIIDSEEAISALTGKGIEELKKKLIKITNNNYNPDSDLIITNARHYVSLKDTSEALQRVIDGLKNEISADFIAQDLRDALNSLGEITGAITSEQILHNIFSRFCIGK